MKKYLFIFGLILTPIFSFNTVFAAVNNPLKGKIVGIYVSKKNLKVHPDCYRLTGAFIRANDTIGLTDENLQLGLSVKLGEFLSENIRKELGADSVYFINALPDGTRSMLKAMNGTTFNFSALTLPASTDFILSVESLNFYSERKQSVAGYSNKLLTQTRIIKKADVNLKLYDLKKKKILGETISSYDEDNPVAHETVLNPRKFTNVGENWVARVFNLSLFLLFGTVSE